MTVTQKIVQFVGLGAIAVSVACTAAVPNGDVDFTSDTDDSLAAMDVGTSYNGWTQSVSGTYCSMSGARTLNHTLSRSSGDTTRGGGGCTVVAKGTSCSTDSNCQAAATAEYGSSAWGYCYNGSCYSRPGGQELCFLNPNRAPGTIGGDVGMGESFNVLGCMTKTAGFNTACGGTNGSLYMRTVGAPTPLSTTTSCPGTTWNGYHCDYCWSYNCDGDYSGCEGPDGAFMPSHEWGWSW
jgi:hypothetical protein